MTREELLDQIDVSIVKIFIDDPKESKGISIGLINSVRNVMRHMVSSLAYEVRNLKSDISDLEATNKFTVKNLRTVQAELDALKKNTKPK